ncbi:MAG: hypothetical protein AAGF79_21010 [Pseudomonadota bacterium]
MRIERSQPSARQSRLLSDRLNGIQGTCIHCDTCDGFCAALIEALTVPEAVLKQRSPE